MHYLTYARIKNGYTQERLAKAIGITRIALSNFERGHSRVHKSTATKLSKVLNVPQENFLKEDMTYEIEYSEYLELKKIILRMRIFTEYDKPKSLKETFLSIKLRKDQSGITLPHQIIGP